MQSKIPKLEPNQEPMTISKSRSWFKTPVRDIQCPPNPQSWLKGHGCSLRLQNQDTEPKFRTWLHKRPVTISKSRSRYQTPSQALQHPHKPNIKDLKNMGVLGTFKSRWRDKIQIVGVPKSNDHIQIKVKMPNPSHEPPASSKAPNQDLKDTNVLCTFKIKIDIQNFEY